MTNFNKALEQYSDAESRGHLDKMIYHFPALKFNGGGEAGSLEVVRPALLRPALVPAGEAATPSYRGWGVGCCSHLRRCCRRCYRSPQPPLLVVPASSLDPAALLPPFTRPLEGLRLATVAVSCCQPIGASSPTCYPHAGPLCAMQATSTTGEPCFWYCSAWCPGYGAAVRAWCPGPGMAVHGVLGLVLQCMVSWVWVWVWV